MDIGKLRSRITIEQPTLASVTGSGQRVRTWNSYISCYASITAPSGLLLDYAKSFSSVVDHIVTIRYSSSYEITKAMRINYGGKIYAIHAVLDKDNTREFLTILCSEDAS